MKFNVIMAVFYKTFKDMMKSKRTMMIFIIFPIMTIIFCNIIPGEKSYFASAFIPMHLIMVPASTMASIIAEEKEKRTLKALILSNVKPFEYFIGIGIFVLLASFLSTLLFLIVMSLSLTELFRFFIIIIFGSLCSMVIGALMGLLTDNQMSANALMSPVAIIFGVIPMFSAFNKTIEKIAGIIYTQGMASVLNNISESITLANYFVFISNFIICLVIFAFIYKNKKLDI